MHGVAGTRSSWPVDKRAYPQLAGLVLASLLRRFLWNCWKPSGEPAAERQERRRLDKDDGEEDQRSALSAQRPKAKSKTSIDLLPLLHAPVHFAPAAIKTESADSGGAKERR